MALIGVMRANQPNLAGYTDEQVLDHVASSNGIQSGTPAYDNLRQQLLGYDRSIGQVVGDTALGVGQGLAAVGQQAVTLGAHAIPGVNPYDNPITNFFGDLQTGLASHESQGLQNQLAGNAVARDIAERRALAAGAGTVGQFGAEAGAQVGNYFARPGTFVQDLATNIPQFFVGGAVGKGAQLGLRAAGIGERLATKAAVGTAIGSGAAMQGADTGHDTYAAILQHGGTPEQAQAGADAALAKSSIASLGLTMLPGGSAIERSLIKGGGGSTFGLGRLANGLRVGATEAAVEGTDEGIGVYARNQATQQVDPNVNLMSGVGQAFVQAGLTAAGPGFVAGRGAEGNQFVAPLPRTETGEIDMTGGTPRVPSETVDDTGLHTVTLPDGSVRQWRDPAPARDFSGAAVPTLARGGVVGPPVPTAASMTDPLRAQQQEAFLNAQNPPPPPPAPPTVQGPGVMVGTSDGTILPNMTPEQIQGMNFAREQQAQQQAAAAPAPAPAPAQAPVMVGTSDGSIIAGQTPEQLQAIALARQQQQAQQAAPAPVQPNINVTNDGTALVGQTPEQLRTIALARQQQAQNTIANGRQPTRGELLAGYQAAKQGNAPALITKAGEISNSRGVRALRPILESNTPLETMRALYQDGAQQGTRDELLDKWHEALTGQDIASWKAEHAGQQASPVTNEAGFVPEPAAQVQAQVDAVREGRKPAVVTDRTQAKTLNTAGLNQGVVLDPRTGEQAVVIAKSPATVKRARKRAQEVGLKQALGEAQQVANPTLTSTESTQPVAAVQQVDNKTGQVLADEAVTPADVPNVKPIKGTTPRIVPTRRVIADRQAASDNDRRKEAARALLGSTRDELKNAVDNGILTQARADELVEQARKTGDAGAADSLILDAIDEAEGSLPPITTPKKPTAIATEQTFTSAATNPPPLGAAIEYMGKSGIAANGQVVSVGTGTKSVVTVRGANGKAVPLPARSIMWRPANTAPVNSINSTKGTPKAKKVVRPKLGRKSTDAVIELAKTTTDRTVRNEARYELYKRWSNTGDEQAQSFLEDAKAKTALDPAETAAFNDRLQAEESAKGKALGNKFDASVNEPLAPFGSDGATVSESTENPDDPYASFETRPGTTEQQRQTGRAALDALDKRITGLRNSRGGATVLGSRLYAGFRAGKANQLTGQHVQNPGDLAALAQVYRDPRFETLRAVFVDATGKVVGESGYTSRMPGAVGLPHKIYDDLVNDQLRFGARGYYVIHNHPSGKAKPSAADVKFTRETAELAPGMISHVVIDHNEYATITPDGQTRVTAAPEFDGVDFLSRPELAHGLLGVSLGSSLAVARLAKTLQTPGGHATVVMTSGGKQGTVQLLVDMPARVLEDTSPLGVIKAKALVRRMARESGSGGHRFIVLPDGAPLTPAYRAFIESGLVRDVVTADGRSLSGKVYWPGDALRSGAIPTHRVQDNTTTFEPTLAKHPAIHAMATAAHDVMAAPKAIAQGKEILGSGLKLLTLRQISEQFGKVLPALPKWVDAILTRSARAAELGMKADNIAIRWQRATRSKATRDALADVLLSTSNAGLDLDNNTPEYLASLDAQDRALHAELSKKLAALPKAAQDVRRDALALLAEQWTYQRDALESFISHTVTDPAERAARIADLHDLMGKSRGNYFPLARFGDRIVIGRDAAKDGGDVVTFHESVASVDAEVARLKAQGVKNIDVTMDTKYDPKARVPNEFVDSLHSIIDGSDTDPTARADLHEAVQQLYLKSIPGLSGAKNLLRRNNVEGFSTDAIRAFADNVTRGSHYAARLEAAPSIQAARESAESQTRNSTSRVGTIVVGRKDGEPPVVRVVQVGLGRLEARNELEAQGYTPESVNTTPEGVAERLAALVPELTADQIKGYTDEMTKVTGRDTEGVSDQRAAKALYNHMIGLQSTEGNETPNRLVQGMGKLGYLWYLGLTPGFWAMNLLQNPMIGIPHLAGKYGFGRAAGEMLKAAKWFGGVRIGKLLKDGKTPFSVDWLEDQIKNHGLTGISKNELAMLRYQENKQLLDFTLARDLARMGKGGTNVFSRAADLAAAGAHHTEVFNRVVMALTSYRLALKSDKNVTHEQAMRMAEQDLAAVHFDYSYANKPQLMRGQWMSLLTMFQQYREHMLYWWGKTIKDAVKNEAPGDRVRALKSATLMAATQLAFAGTMGLPFIGTAEFLANLFGGEDDDGEPFDFERWMTDAATEATGSAKAGQLMAKGLFAALGANVSRRIGQADLLPFLNEGSEKFEHNPDDKLRAYLFDLAGPLGSIALGGAKAYSRFGTGDIAGGLAATTPKVVSDILKAYSLATDGLKNAGGQTLAAPGDLTTSDKIMQGLGVQPLKVSNIRADRQRVTDLDQHLKARTNQLTGAFVQAWTRGDRAGMTEAINDIKAFNLKIMSGRLANPAFAITGRKLESAARDFRQRQLISILTGGTAQDKRQLMMAMRLSGDLATPVTPASISGNMVRVPTPTGLQ